MTRTECDCAVCQTCCRTMPGYLAPGDVEKILAAFGLNWMTDAGRLFVRTHFAASEGAIVQRGAKRFNIPTIVPQQRADKTCVFFAAGRCTIHAVAPFGCAMFDPHMPVADANEISHVGINAIASDLFNSGPYQTVRQHLASARKYAAPRDVRRGDMVAAFAELEAAGITHRRPDGGLEKPK